MDQITSELFTHGIEGSTFFTSERYCMRVIVVKVRVFSDALNISSYTCSERDKAPFVHCPV